VLAFSFQRLTATHTYESILVLLWIAYPLGLPTADYPPYFDMIANGAPHSFVNGHIVEIMEV
jgi:hypothetical protein